MFHYAFQTRLVNSKKHFLTLWVAYLTHKNKNYRKAFFWYLQFAIIKRISFCSKEIKTLETNGVEEIKNINRTHDIPGMILLLQLSHRRNLIFYHVLSYCLVYQPFKSFVILLINLPLIALWKGMAKRRDVASNLCSFAKFSDSFLLCVILFWYQIIISWHNLAFFCKLNKVTVKIFIWGSWSSLLKRENISQYIYPQKMVK